MNRTSDSHSGLPLAGRRLRLPNGNNVEPEGPDRLGREVLGAGSIVLDERRQD
jgi:hypothetical protein